MFINRTNRVQQYLNKQFVRLMILRQGFWFIDIPRTSSSSIKAVLGESCGCVYGKTNLLEKQYATPQILDDHLPASDMRTMLGRFIWDKIFTFTIVRNPWERNFSMFNYRKKEGSIPQKLTFRDYVLALDKIEEHRDMFWYHAHRCGASHYVLDAEGTVIVDFIAKYENRSEDLQAVGSRIKIRNLEGLHIQSVSPNHKHYSEFYDEELKEIIQRRFARDIELFDYTFEHGT